ncbi:MAG TPA: TSUP family transporter, partial [Bacteroidota bacterium]|nr:TSUP family transporter [Bacteroidota bacterium]
PGVGTFWAMAFVLGLGFTLTRATGYTKVMNFTSNIVSLLVFAIGGNVLWAPGAVMAVGQIIGARLGSGMVVKRGVRFIRPVFIVMVILTTLKLLSDRLL